MQSEEKETLEGLIRVLEDIKTTSIKIDREQLLPFLFEYACQTIEYDKMKPADLYEEIEVLMYCKLDAMVETQMAENYQKKGTQKLLIPPMEKIPFIILEERALASNSIKNEQSNRRGV